MEIGVPCPTPLPLKAARGAIKEAVQDVERHVFCARYQGCLGLAVKAGWDAWTCRRCSLRFQASQGLVARGYAEQRSRGWND